MLSETLTNGLKRYEIGSKIRTLRLRKKLGLVQLGEHTGLSAALLSKIERGNLFPTLPTLLRIAMVFGVGLDYFFVESDDNPIAQITRRDERVRLPNRPAGLPSYFFESLNFDVRDRKVVSTSLNFQQDRNRRICMSMPVQSSSTSSRGDWLLQ